MLKKHPRIILCLPNQLCATVKYKFKVIDKTKFKESFYCYFKKIPDIDEDLKSFWDKNGYKIKKWYKNQKRENDVIISASPEFLLYEICKNWCK